MADVNVSVNVDGKTVFVHGAAGSPDATTAVLNGLLAGVDHFQRVKDAASPRTLVSGAGQSSPLNTKGPTL